MPFCRYLSLTRHRRRIDVILKAWDNPLFTLIEMLGKNSFKQSMWGTFRLWEALVTSDKAKLTSTRAKPNLTFTRDTLYGQITWKAVNACIVYEV
jgi:hypothetical protein